MLTTIDLGLHHAVIDLASGDGFLILPLPRQDIRWDGESLQEADRDAALADLAACGWRLTECDEDGVLRQFQGFTADGRAFVGLVGDHPMTPDLGFAERALAWTEAKKAAQGHRCSMVLEQDSC